MDGAKFEKGFKPVKISVRDRMGKLVVPPQPLKSALKPPCSQQEWLQFLLTHIQILSWVWSYRPGFLIGDFIAGITVAIMHIPQGLAYAILAEVLPVYGLYASLVPPIILELPDTYQLPEFHWSKSDVRDCPSSATSPRENCSNCSIVLPIFSILPGPLSVMLISREHFELLFLCLQKGHCCSTYTELRVAMTHHCW